MGVVAACFHAQQAAEKYLKAYLSLKCVDFPFLHNLAALVEICKGEDETFGEIREVAESLTPCAVEARYDEDFWPDLDTARKAVQQAHAISSSRVRLHVAVLRIELSALPLKSKHPHLCVQGKSR